MIIREMQPQDFDTVVDMYEAMCKEVYPHRTFNSREAFENNVAFWVKLNFDILVTVHKDEVVGFMMCFYDDMGGIVEPFYKFECAYIKPEYRNSRAVILMRNTMLSYADREGIIIQCNASLLTQSSKIVSKFGIEIFKTYERMPNGLHHML